MQMQEPPQRRLGRPPQAIDRFLHTRAPRHPFPPLPIGRPSL
jgi:hypothetical protein